MATLLTQLVGDRLFEQRTRQDSLSVEKLASMAAPFFSSARMNELEDMLHSAAAEMGGRVLVLDRDGKIQLDTYNEMWGQRLTLPETTDVLARGRALSYGIHPTEDGSYTACCAAAMLSQGEVIGLLAYFSPVQELADSLNSVRHQQVRLFLIFAGIAMIAALIFSRIITRPITALNKAIQKMGRGDLSARVAVRASGEMRDLADSYNAMAEKIEHFDQSRSQFVSNASHELKTPLTTMKILLESMIYQPDMPGELRDEFLQDMNHEIDRLTGVVTDLLTLTQTDSRESALRLDRVDLSELTEETVRLLLPAAQKRSQQLTARIDPDVTAVCDRSKMTQVITNLTDNALKYTPDGGEVTVTLTQDSREAILTVQDNGVGIPKEDQAHIFDRFYRVDKARSRATGGTGLGLSIVKQMVSMHRGAIEVESEPGQGSIFTLRLPLKQEDNA